MRKYWKWIIAILAVLLIGLLVCFIFFRNTDSGLPESEKEKIEKLYYEQMIPVPERPEDYPLIWYDENEGVEEKGVWRYIGTYGDCYAFLIIGDNLADIGVFPPYTMPNPYPIQGLTRDVYYSVEADIVLYHTKEKMEYGNQEHATQMALLSEIDNVGNREDWVTNEQLEKLTQDIEQISAVRD